MKEGLTQKIEDTLMNGSQVCKHPANEEVNTPVNENFQRKLYKRCPARLTVHLIGE